MAADSSTEKDDTVSFFMNGINWTIFRQRVGLAIPAKSSTASQDDLEEAHPMHSVWVMDS